MLSYCTMQTELGAIALAATEKGLCCLYFGLAEQAWLDGLRDRWGETPTEDAAALASIRHELVAYFAGERQQFSIAVDLRSGTAFQQRVWQATTRVPYGVVQSYADIARAIGQPGATRAVGTALGRNPIPVVVPCHRIIRSDGTLGGFSIGIDLKRMLLALEGYPAGCALPGLDA